jgi:hypothetical protein
MSNVELAFVCWWLNCLEMNNFAKYWFFFVAGAFFMGITIALLSDSFPQGLDIQNTAVEVVMDSVEARHPGEEFEYSFVPFDVSIAGEGVYVTKVFIRNPKDSVLDSVRVVIRR